ncbi:hypothetical protein ONZ45_g19157 [Pleurotus djamor]|nr:hypothetical protein ONZ45_g19157 [Pleurotus djamor]
MFEPVRGGTRGGQAEFKWSDVSADKDRENYLGHSINAPTGRWQKNKDVHWYNRDLKDSAEERREEIRKVKEAEAEALSMALGFGPAAKGGGGPSISAVPTSPTATRPSVGVDPAVEAAEKEAKEAKKRRKAERKEEKRARKEKHRSRRSVSRDRDEYVVRRERGRERSRSPRRVSRERGEREERRRDYAYAGRGETEYDAAQRERERERDRRLWEMNSRRYR